MVLTVTENMGNKQIQYFLNEQVRLAFYLRLFCLLFQLEMIITAIIYFP